MADLPPPPLPPSVPRVNPDGTPTAEVVSYEQRLNAWLRKLATG